MSCKDAMIAKVAVARQSDTVETALALLKGEPSGIVPVVDGDGRTVVGIFSRRGLLQEILPASVNVPVAGEIDSVSMPMSAGMLAAAPGLSKRLQKLMLQPLSAVVPAKFASVSANTPLWEGISRLGEAGEALAVLDEDGGLQGIISETSLLNALEAMP
jgi:CBS-domain-containing membrane protein